MITKYAIMSNVAWTPTVPTRKNAAKWTTVRPFVTLLEKQKCRHRYRQHRHRNFSNKEETFANSFFA